MLAVNIHSCHTEHLLGPCSLCVSKLFLDPVVNESSERKSVLSLQCHWFKKKILQRSSGAKSEVQQHSRVKGELCGLLHAVTKRSHYPLSSSQGRPYDSPDKQPVVDHPCAGSSFSGSAGSSLCSLPGMKHLLALETNSSHCY